MLRAGLPTPPKRPTAGLLHRLHIVDRDPKTKSPGRRELRRGGSFSSINQSTALVTCLRFRFAARVTVDVAALAHAADLRRIEWLSPLLELGDAAVLAVSFVLADRRQFGVQQIVDLLLASLSFGFIAKCFRGPLHFVRVIFFDPLGQFVRGVADRAFAHLAACLSFSEVLRASFRSSSRRLRRSNSSRRMRST